MARIRSIKPEFWTSEQIMECSMNARLLFIGMWNFADDLGRLPLSVKTIKASVFPGDDIALDIVRGMIDELSRNGLILTYVVEDREYLQITGWQHQRIDKPQAGKCPSPVNGYSKTIRGTFPPDRKGKEGKGEDGSAAIAAGAEAPLDDPSEPEREYFARGRKVLGKSAGGQLAKLLKINGGNVSLSRSTLELAATKHNPVEFFARAVMPQSQGPPPGKGGFTSVLMDKHMERQNGTSDHEPEFSEH